MTRLIDTLYPNLSAARAAREADGATLARRIGPVCTETPLTAGQGTGLRLLPKDAPDAGTRDPLVFVHGGGWVFGSPRQAVALASQIAVLAARPVHSVGYRRAPEQAYPAAHDDVVAGLRDAAGRCVTGFSAGANLALTATLELRDASADLPGRLILFYPVADSIGQDWSHITFGQQPDALSQARMAAYAEAYAPSPDQARKAVHLIGADLHDLPPVDLICGDRDMLLCDTLSLYRALILAGNAASLTIVPGQGHGFANDWLDDAAIADLLTRFFKEN